MGELNEQGERVVELFAGFIPVTAEGRARARKLLDDADAKRDPDRRAKLRADLGLPPRD